MASKEKTLQEKILEMLNLNVSEYVEEKNKLKYLSWANAVKEALKIDHDFTYTIVKNEEGIPIFGNPKFGYMVYTTVTFEHNTKECWLPVMDGANKPMKDEPYEYETKYKGPKKVDALNMFDINKTVMRCLVKNLAMFGLGLYIYAGEDLPEQIEESVTPGQLTQINSLVIELGINTKVKAEKDKMYNWLKIESFKSLGINSAEKVIEKLKKAKKQKEDKK